MEHHLPIVAVVLHGPVFTQRTRADASLVFDSFTVVEHVAIWWKVCGEYDELVYLVKAALAIYTNVSWSISANAHHGPPRFRSGAAVVLSVKWCVNVVAVVALFVGAELVESGLHGGMFGLERYPSSSGGK